jgi:hypothetical protein
LSSVPTGRIVWLPCAGNAGASAIAANISSAAVVDARIAGLA